MLLAALEVLLCALYRLFATVSCGIVIPEQRGRSAVETNHKGRNHLRDIYLPYSLLLSTGNSTLFQTIHFLQSSQVDLVLPRESEAGK
jgi:hypothetical protein